MKHLAAYMLLALGGNATPSADDVKKVVTASGGSVDDEQLTLLMSKVEGKSLDELIAAGEEKLVAIGGAVGGGAGGAAGGDGGAAAEEAKVEEEVEEVDMGGGNLFGDDGGDGY